MVAHVHKGAVHGSFGITTTTCEISCDNPVQYVSGRDQTLRLAHASVGRGSQTLLLAHSSVDNLEWRENWLLTRLRAQVDQQSTMAGKRVADSGFMATMVTIYIYIYS